MDTPLDKHQQLRCSDCGRSSSAAGGGGENNTTRKMINNQPQQPRRTSTIIARRHDGIGSLAAPNPQPSRGRASRSALQRRRADHDEHLFAPRPAASLDQLDARRAPNELFVSAKLNRLRLNDQCDEHLRLTTQRAQSAHPANSSSSSNGPTPAGQQVKMSANVGGAHFGGHHLNREVTLIDRTTRQLSSDLHMHAMNEFGQCAHLEHHHQSYHEAGHELVHHHHHHHHALVDSYHYDYDGSAHQQQSQYYPSDKAAEAKQHQHAFFEHHNHHQQHHHHHPQQQQQPHEHSDAYLSADVHHSGLKHAAYADDGFHDEGVSLVDLDAHNQFQQQQQQLKARPASKLPETVIQVNEFHQSMSHADQLSASFRNPTESAVLNAQHSGASSLASLSLSNSTTYSSTNNEHELATSTARRRNSTQPPASSGAHQQHQHQHYSASFSQQQTGNFPAGPQQQQQFGAAGLHQSSEQPCAFANPNGSYYQDSLLGQCEADADEPDELEDDEEAEELKVCEWENCGHTFLDMQEFVRHLEERHVNQEPREKNRYFCLWSNCKRNSQEFNARYKLLIHMRVHSGEKPYPCLEDKNCKKSFSRLENLKIHVRSHTGEKPYKCNYSTCTKSFTNSSDRIKHHKTHQNPKPYNCSHDGCLKRYTDPSSLRKHLRAHRRQLTHLATGSCRSARQRESMARAGGYAQRQARQQQQQQQMNLSACSSGNNNCCSAGSYYATQPDDQQRPFARQEAPQSMGYHQQQQQQPLPADYDPSVVLEEFVVVHDEQQFDTNELLLADCAAQNNYAEQPQEPISTWQPPATIPSRPVAVQQQHRWRQHHAMSRSWCAGSASAAGAPHETAGSMAGGQFWQPSQWGDGPTVNTNPDEQQQQQQIGPINSNNNWPVAQQQQQRAQFRQHEQLMRSMPASNHLL